MRSPGPTAKSSGGSLQPTQPDERVDQSQPVPAEPSPTVPPRAPAEPRRAYALALVVIAVLLLLLGAAAWFGGWVPLVAKYVSVVVAGGAALYASRGRVKGVDKEPAHLRTAYVLAIAGFTSTVISNVSTDVAAAERSRKLEAERVSLEELITRNGAERAIHRLDKVSASVTVRMPFDRKVLGSYCDTLRQLVKVDLPESARGKRLLGHVLDNAKVLAANDTAVHGISVDVRPGGTQGKFDPPQPILEYLEQASLTVDIFKAPPVQYAPAAAFTGVPGTGGGLFDLLGGVTNRPDLHMRFRGPRVTRVQWYTLLGYVEFSLSFPDAPNVATSGDLAAVTDLHGKTCFAYLLGGSKQNQDMEQSAEMPGLNLELNDRLFVFGEPSEADLAMQILMGHRTWQMHAVSGLRGKERVYQFLFPSAGDLSADRDLFWGAKQQRNR